MAAQRFEQPAIDKLCADFTPLINKEAHRQSVFNALGEDAVNIAWEIFLEFIHSYKGNNYRLPKTLAERAKELTLEECMTVVKEQDEKPKTTARKRTYSKKK